jgi:TRAP-type transport system small permease protein
MKTLIKTLKAINGVITAVLKYVTIVLFLAITLIVVANILLRIFPITSLHWTDEIVELCFASMVFYGAAGVWMGKGHFSVGDWISKRIKSKRGQAAYRLLLELICLAFTLILFKYSLSLTLKAREVTSVFQISKKVLYSCMPIGSLIMSIYSCVFVIVEATRIAKPDAFQENIK